MGKASQERMTGYTYEERVKLGKKRTEIYLQRRWANLSARFRGKPAPIAKKPTREEAEA